MYTIHDLVALLFLVSFLMVAVTTLTFNRYSLRNIDARMKASGVPIPWGGDKTGLRIGFSAFIIALPIKKYEGQIDVYASLRNIKPYATNADKRWALAMILSEFFWLAAIVLAGIYGFGVEG